MRQAVFTIENEGGKPFDVTVKGRDRWALECIMQGPVTPITHPAPRWSAYIHKLRGLGVKIETEFEPHKGAFPGSHGKYHLKSKVTFVGEASK